jgi:hypothetical protein
VKRKVRVLTERKKSYNEGKIFLIHAIEAQRIVMVELHSFLNSILVRVERSTSFRPLYHRKKPEVPIAREFGGLQNPNITYKYYTVVFSHRLRILQAASGLIVVVSADKRSCLGSKFYSVGQL